MQLDTDAVQRMFKAIETGDLSDAEAYIAPAYLNRESADDGRSIKRGPDEFRETTVWLRSFFSDLHFEHIEIFGCANGMAPRIVVVTWMTGRHTAPFLGLPATNRTFRQRQIHLFHMAPDGKVLEHLAQRDDLGLRRQLAPA
jgi:predicted ester cyclase